MKAPTRPPAGESRERARLVYILAASHSGSTLLAMLLNAHPEIATVGELKASALGDPDHYLCSCRKKIRECAFWSDVGEAMKRKGHPFSITRAGTDLRSISSPYVTRLLRPLHRGPILEGIRDAALACSPTWRSSLPRIQQLNEALIDCLCIRTGKKVLVDSSKIGIRLKYLLKNPALDVRVLRLARDGRGVGLTYMNPSAFADASDPSLRGGGTGETQESGRRSMDEAAREWRRSNEEAEAIVRRLDRSKWMEVRYEALCESPDSTMGGIFEFLGVDPDPGRTNFRSAEHHVIGNGMRMDSTSEIRLDERWKWTLDASALSTFEKVAGEMNRHLGY